MSMMSDLDVQVQELQMRGFDVRPDPEPTDEDVGSYLRVHCTQCEALVINGTPTHETGCPNAMRECAGCNNLIPRLQFSRFCEDCR